MRGGTTLVLLVLSMTLGAQEQGDNTKAYYVGARVCGQCHRSIAQTQTQTAMANTWQTDHTAWLPGDFQATTEEGGVDAVASSVKRALNRFSYTARLGGGQSATLPVEAMVGGERHGLGFLARATQLEGAVLARPVLLQTRFAYSMSDHRLILSPGLPETKPRSFETALGLPLSPEYERRCLECHGKPNTLGAGKEGGVQCESCHGPGSVHLQAIAKGTPRLGIVNPKRLGADQSIDVCAQCHVGLTKISDPTPVDLLVANQVGALKSSECFVQSRQAVSCSTCHNPHDDRATAAKSMQACLGCHSAGASRRASLCPVNQRDGCVGCHMPSVEIGPFHLVDHWIRVHPQPEDRTPHRTDGSLGQTQFARVSKFLEQLESRTAEGSATSVKYLGRRRLTDLEPGLAAVAEELNYGETSKAVAIDDRFVRLRRMPRDFQSRAGELAYSAEVRFASGDLEGALVQSRQALSIYPHCLRALVAMGRVLSARGAFLQALEVLQRANRLYPDDANAAYHLARVLGKLGRTTEALANYRRAIQSDPDFVSAYLNLGKALTAIGDTAGAAVVFRRGLDVNPLDSALYRDLSIVLAKQGESRESAKALETAARIEAGSEPKQ